MKLTNDEKLKVFSLYLGCRCIIGDVNWKRQEIAAIDLAPYVDPDYGKPIKTDVCLHTIQQYGHQLTLLLTPLSKITKAHKLAIYAMGFTHVVNDRLEIMELHKWPYMRPEQHQQLVIWGYAVKLHFGIGHWANGKTAIELEIALDVTEQNGRGVIK